MTTISLKPAAPPPPTCTIVIEPGAVDRAADIVGKLGAFDSIAILYDASVEAVAKRVQRSLGTEIMLPVQSGEASKSLLEVERIAKELVKHHVSRSAIIINVGGGMLTDLGGFVASIYARGIPFAHVPTTMLGMVDAGIGGKTGVDLGRTKNILGTIQQPSATIIDTDLLQHLPDHLLREGLVEVVKIAAMLDAKAFNILEKSMPEILQKEPKALHACVEMAVRLKVALVEEDEREAFKRMFVNFGHTVGHALETASNFSLSHGQAVSIGMAAEMAIAGSQGSQQIVALLAALGMPTTLDASYDADQLWQIMKNDKKVAKGKVRMAVPIRIGEGEIRELTQEQFSSYCV